MKKPQFSNNEIYHIYNRGVEKRDIFLDKQDYFRFINSLAEFNDIKPALPSNIRYLLRNPSQTTSLDIEKRLDVVNLNNLNREKEPLVEILAFCLMPNHYHLLARQLIDGGVVKFMKKLGSGYANYFNLKRKRVGPLFQGRFKAILVDKDEYLQYLSLYIHLNPLDLTSPEWRDSKIYNLQKTLDFLTNYQWSSYLDYMGKDNFPLITNREFLLSISNGTNNFKRNTIEFIESLNLEKIRDLILE